MAQNTLRQLCLQSTTIEPPTTDRPQYSLLGPLEVWRCGRPVDIGGPQQRTLLAVLLLNANRMVGTDRLIEHLWGVQPPQTAKALLHGCISHLRRVLNSSSNEQVLVTRGSGYVLRVDTEDLDLLRFRHLTDAAACLPDGEHRVRLLSEALACWKGAVATGQDLPSCSEEIAELEERRTAALEDRLVLDLSLSVHAGLLVEVRAAVRRHPLRERLWALLIAALYGLDRQAEALATYRELRQSLIDQLGIEPSVTLRELHQQILSGTNPGDLIIPVGAENLRRTG
ncbi:winged helix-turn-helix domain-containing protein [Kribbella sp. NBC_01505]